MLYLMANACKSTAGIVARRNTIYPITSKSLSQCSTHVHTPCLKRVWKMELNEPGRQGLQRQNSWQQAKHRELYFDLFQALQKRTLDSSECSTDASLNFMTMTPMKQID